MRVVALEEHVLPPALLEATFPGGEVPPPTAATLEDYAGGRLAAMDAAGIDVQVLSTVGYGLQSLPPDASVAAARDANDRMAAAVTAHPDRFAAFAVLPMTDPEAAAVEFERAHAEGFVGAMIFGQTDGRFLDHPRVAPVLETADRLRCPIYLHPAPPPAEVAAAYYSDLGVAGPVMAQAGWGWHAECGMHILRLAVSGTFDRYPGLQMIVGHMGENLPFSLARADSRFGLLDLGLRRSLTDTVLDHTVITTCGYLTEPPLQCALAVFGPDRVLFSVDYPFCENHEAAEFLRNARIAEDTRTAIAAGNARRVLGV